MTEQNETNEETNSIRIIPNLKAMSQQFLKDAMLWGERFQRHSDPEVLSLFRSFIVCLNIAVQCVADNEDILNVRQEIDTLSVKVVKRDDRLKGLYTEEEEVTE